VAGFFIYAPSVVWAYLTSPALRTIWEGPLAIEETSPGGRRGVGTVVQCVTDRLSTLEEVVDSQPYDHVGWRHVVPSVGSAVATADLTTIDAGMRVRMRWGLLKEAVADTDAITQMQVDRRAAFERLIQVVAKAPALSLRRRHFRNQPERAADTLRAEP
jgi:hypothetical protein